MHRFNCIHFEVDIVLHLHSAVPCIKSQISLVHMFFRDKTRLSPAHYSTYKSLSVPFFCFVSIMACCSSLLTFWLILSMFICCQSANKDECIYQGDEGTHSFFKNGDVILGGLFPLHYSPVLAVQSFQSKPQPTDYK